MLKRIIKKLNSRLTSIKNILKKKKKIDFEPIKGLTHRIDLSSYSNKSSIKNSDSESKNLKIFRSKLKSFYIKLTSPIKKASSGLRQNKVVSKIITKVKIRFPKFKRPKITTKSTIRLIAVLLLLTALVNIGLRYKERAESVTVEKVTINLFMSKGSRDKEKIIKDDFFVNDPIQAEINFVEADDSTALSLTLKLDEELINEYTIPISGTSSRFATISPPGATLRAGNYIITIAQNGYVITKKEFLVK